MEIDTATKLEVDLNILPCPFCGGSAGLEVVSDGSTGMGISGDTIQIRCGSCRAAIGKEGYAGDNFVGRTKSVVSRWQSRAGPLESDWPQWRKPPTEPWTR